MTIPTRSVLHSPSLLQLHSQYHVFEDLVDRMANVQRPVGVRGPIVEDEWSLAGSFGRLPLVQVISTLAEIFLLELRVGSSTRSWSVNGQQLSQKRGCHTGSLKVAASASPSMISTCFKQNHAGWQWFFPIDTIQPVIGNQGDKWLFRDRLAHRYRRDKSARLQLGID
jgi:hypothetical protein